VLPWSEFIFVFIFLICLLNWKYVNDVVGSALEIIVLLTFGFLAGLCGCIVEIQYNTDDRCGGIVGYLKS